MAFLAILSVLSLWVIWCPATASQGDDRVDKMEDRLKTMEMKFNQYMEEYGLLLQVHKELKKRDDELTIKMNYLEETVRDIRLSNARCQMDIKTLSKFIEDNSNTSIWNRQKVEETTTSTSNEVNTFSSYIQNQKRIVPATVAPIEQIAIYAYISKDTQADLRQHHILMFDVVKVNKGQGYHQDDGIFTVPSTGVYVFAWIVAVQNRGWASVEIVVNGEVCGSTFADDDDGGDWDQGTGIVVTEMHTGDHVYVRMQENGRGVVNSNARARSSFSGWKLFKLYSLNNNKILRIRYYLFFSVLF